MQATTLQELEDMGVNTGGADFRAGMRYMNYLNRFRLFKAGDVSDKFRGGKLFARYWAEVNGRKMAVGKRAA